MTENSILQLTILIIVDIVIYIFLYNTKCKIIEEFNAFSIEC